MGELMNLSSDLNVITAEINSYKNVAGQAIFEIGKRLKHVKENDLVHGEFGKWLESIDMNHSTANKFMKVYSELGSKSDTYQKLSFNALVQISTMPEEVRDKQHTIPSSGEQKTVDEMTVRELREVKETLKKVEEAKRQAELKAQQAKKSEEIAIKRLEAAENKPPRVIEKEVVKEVIPENIKKKIEEKDRFLNAMKRETEMLQEEIKALKLVKEDEPEDAEQSERKLKRLEREANIETLQIVVNIQKFLKETALSTYQLGAVAYSSEPNKTKIKEHIKMLEDFSRNLKATIDGRIQI